MFNKKIGAKLALALVAVTMVFTACTTTKKAIISGDAKADFSAWKGEWVSADAEAENPKAKMIYENAAKENPNYTKDGIKDGFLGMYRSPVSKVVFDGSDTVKFTVKDDNSEKVVTVAYKYVGKVNDLNWEGVEWEAFEATGNVRGMFKYIVALAPHKHGEGNEHWHARFSNVSIEALTKAKNWPTFFRTSVLKNADDVLKTMKDSIGYLPKSPFKDYAGKTEWINSALLYRNNSVALQNVYDKIIKEFAGKNPKGGDFTKEEIISIMEKTYGTPGVDFTHIKFDITNDVNELVLLKNSKEIGRYSYKRVGENAEKAGLMALVTDNKNAGVLTNIVMTGAHGTPKHFHFWYGKNASDVKSITSVPTCIPANTPDEDIAKRVEKSCRYVLKGMTK